MTGCCTRSEYAPIETIEWTERPPRASLWCRSVVARMTKDPEFSILTHLFLLSLTAAASGIASYLEFNSHKDPIQDQNRLFPATLSFLGFCLVVTFTSEGFRLKRMMKMSRKLPSPCVVASVAVAVAASVAFWMRQQAALEIDRYQKNESLPYPERAYQVIASDEVSDWLYAFGGILLTTLFYHVALRAIIRCRTVNPEEEVLFIN